MPKWIPTQTGSGSTALAALLLGAIQLVAVQPALAAPEFLPELPLGALEVIQLSIVAGVLGAAMLTVIWTLRERSLIAAENSELRGRLADLNAAVERAEAFLQLRDQRLVIWPPEPGRPEIAGELGPRSGMPEDRSEFFAFGRWVEPRSAAELERALTELRPERAPFSLVIASRSGELLEVEGRMAAGHAIVRFLPVGVARKALAELTLAHRRLRDELETLRALLDEAPMPVWLRGTDGRLQWVNRAFAEAAESESPQAAIAAGKEFLGAQARESISRHQAQQPLYQGEVSAVVAGERRVYSVRDVVTPAGSAGLALDVSEIDAIRREMDNLQKSHAETLDQLTTAVAIYDRDEKLRFYNQAFQKLWGLDTAFLASAPDNALVMDRLRSERKLAEQPEWRRWLDNLMLAYRAVDPQEHWWHLPDGRTLRVIGNPHPRGGVTWVFENLTEKIDLESRYKTLLRVQGETLDNLAEGVAVFGPDGRLRLANPAFATLWRLPRELVREGVHITAVRKACDEVAVDSPWIDYVAAVTGFDEERRDHVGQIELQDGTVLRSALNPLPNGQVMLTFVDVTDSVRVERALKEKNEALERADRLKDDFVQHVSYELRSPLTNIIGFTELLAMETAGKLNERQRDYVNHIGASSAVLLTIVNDILDLATVDAGFMELEISEVPVGETLRSAVSLVAERCAELGIEVEIDTGKAPRTIHVDGGRLRQILYNLLVNAVNYAPEGSTIEVVCRGGEDEVVFEVHDDGPGIPDEVLKSLFRPFEAHSRGSRKRGAGLGLAIVKGFVELHGGSVEIETSPRIGTTVICRFPMRPALREAAE
jgi:signal transduction histidine kinase